MKNNSTDNWINNNKQRLRYYKRKYIAYTLEDGIIAYNDELQSLVTEAKKIKEHFVVYYVNPLMFKTRILPIHFRTIKTHDWEPVREFTLTNQEKSLSLPMLVDSGADCQDEIIGREVIFDAFDIEFSDTTGNGGK